LALIFDAPRHDHQKIIRSSDGKPMRRNKDHEEVPSGKAASMPNKPTGDFGRNCIGSRDSKIKPESSDELKSQNAERVTESKNCSPDDRNDYLSSGRWNIIPRSR